MGLSDKRQLIEPKLENITLSQQCELLNLTRSSFYYSAKVNQKKKDIKAEIAKVFKKVPIYGAKKVHQQRLEDGIDISLNSVATYRKELSLKAVLAVKQANKEHMSLTVTSLEALILAAQSSLEYRYHLHQN